MILFNKPYLTGSELDFIKEAIYSGKISGNGLFTKKVHDWFQEKYDFSKVLMTSSCTDALEMCGIAIGLEPGDEVIVPDYTFVSSANAFVLRGAKIVFADSRDDHPGVDEAKIEELITNKTKAIVVVHYAGVAVNMPKVMEIAKKYGLFVIEDAAQAIDSYFSDGIVNSPLGSFGDFATFSFHDTKNIISGEGGLLVINNPKYFDLMEVIWEKGTNRSSFFKGEVNKYGWVEKGSSFLPSELVSAFLYGQLQNIEFIQNSRISIWRNYNSLLFPMKNLVPDFFPFIPSYATNNAHMFYVKARDISERDELLAYLKSKGIYAVFHYLPLHQSSFIKNIGWEQRVSFSNSIRFSNSLIRLPFYIGLSIDELTFITDEILKFYKKK